MFPLNVGCSDQHHERTISATIIMRKQGFTLVKYSPPLASPHHYFLIKKLTDMVLYLLQTAYLFELVFLQGQLFLYVQLQMGIHNIVYGENSSFINNNVGL